MEFDQCGLSIILSRRDQCMSALLKPACEWQMLRAWPVIDANEKQTASSDVNSRHCMELKPSVKYRCSMTREENGANRIDW